MSSNSNNRKRRYLGKLINDLQNSNKINQNEPVLQKKRVLAVPLCQHLQPHYEFFLIGEINIELNLDVEEDYYPIGIKQSPLNKWRPFQKAELFHNRVEVTIDASYPGISEFEFLIHKLQGCSNDVLNQLGLYLHNYQHFVRRIKQKMLKNPVPSRLYDFKLQNFLKAASDFVGKLPIDGYYAVSVMQLDYNIHNTKRIKFIASKAISELISGQDYSEAADILLRKGWMEVFGGPQRILKNIMLLNRLMKEGKQLLTFMISTIDKIRIQVQAEIEIIQSLRSYVDVGFVEIIRFSISPDVIAGLAATREALKKMHVNDEHSDSLQYRHPNFDKHETDLSYNSNCKAFVQKFYTKQEIPNYLRTKSHKPFGVIPAHKRDKTQFRNTSNSIEDAQDQYYNYSTHLTEGVFSAFDGSCCSSNHEEFISQLPTQPLDYNFFQDQKSSKDIDQHDDRFQQEKEDITDGSKLPSSIPDYQSVLNEKQEQHNMIKSINAEEDLLSGEFHLGNKSSNKGEDEEFCNDGEPEYFNIFDDESLNETAQDLRDQQRRIQKLLYTQYKSSFH